MEISSPSERAFNVCDFGAVGDGSTLDTAAFVAAARACREAGGGVLLAPPGVYVCGLFELYGATTLRLERGATLLGSPRFEDRLTADAIGGILFARDADAVCIEGEGTIDGNAACGAFFEENAIHLPLGDVDILRTRQGAAYGDSDPSDGPFKPRRRPGNLIVLAGCTNVRIEGVRITGATYWTLHLADCADVRIHHLTVDNDPRLPNNDGIHLTSCQRVVIEDCRIVTGDDAVAITGFREHGGEREIALGLRGRVGVCEDITVRRCSLSSRSAAVRVGYGHNPCRRIRLEELDCFHCYRGIGIFARQSGVEDVLVRNVRVQTQLYGGNWWGRGEPLHISAVRYYGETTLYAVRGVVVENLVADAENGIHLYAEEPGAVEDVTLRHVSVELRLGPLFELWGGNLDLRPAKDRAIAIHAGGNAPLWAHGVRRLRLEDFRSAVTAEAARFFEPGFHLEGCSEVESA